MISQSILELFDKFSSNELSQDQYKRFLRKINIDNQFYEDFNNYKTGLYIINSTGKLIYELRK